MESSSPFRSSAPAARDISGVQQPTRPAEPAPAKKKRPPRTSARPPGGVPPPRPSARPSGSLPRPSARPPGGVTPPRPTARAPGVVPPPPRSEVPTPGGVPLTWPTTRAPGVVPPPPRPEMPTPGGVPPCQQRSLLPDLQLQLLPDGSSPCGPHGLTFTEPENFGYDDDFSSTPLPLFDWTPDYSTNDPMTQDVEDELQMHIDQPFMNLLTQDVDDTPSSSRKGASKRGSNYTHDEDMQLCISWMNISNDSKIGTDQPAGTYWARIANDFHKNKDFVSNRSVNSLEHRCTIIIRECMKFQGFYDEVERRRPSGFTHQEYVMEAQARFAGVYGKTCQFLHCWLKVKNSEKFTKIPSNVVGSLGYMAPEYLYRGEISTQSDIYSLGILIIQISTGEKIKPSHDDRCGTNFIDHVRKNWTDHKIVTMHMDHRRLKEVKKCIEVGLQCVDIDRKKRPSIVEIIAKLDGNC